MSKLGKALPPVLMAAAIIVAFGAMMFLTVWYSPDRQSPHQSIAVGGVVLLEGCGGTPSTWCVVKWKSPEYGRAVIPAAL